MTLPVSTDLKTTEAGRQQLQLLDQISAMLQDAQSLDEVTEVHSAAEAARSFAKAAKLGLEMQNRAAELKLRAERKAGAFLSGLALHGGNRRSRSPAATLKLEDLGVSKQQSQRWRLIASVAEDDFERYIRAQNELGAEVTAAGLRRIARNLKQRRREKKNSRAVETILDPTFGVTAIFDQMALAEIAAELAEHRNLLHSLLVPVCEGKTPPFRLVERRHIGRLLGEMRVLIDKLHKHSRMHCNGK